MTESLLIFFLVVVAARESVNGLDELTGQTPLPVESSAINGWTLLENFLVVFPPIVLLLSMPLWNTDTLHCVSTKLRTKDSAVEMSVRASAPVSNDKFVVENPCRNV